MKKIISLLILLLPVVYSFNFGTVPKSNYKTVEQGESTQFTILLWNLGEKSYPVNVELKNELPGWEIIVRPQDFILEPTNIASPPYDDGEYIPIPGKGNVKAEILRVFVKVPNSAASGEYDLILLMRAGNLNDQLSVFQERELKLTVEVEKGQTVFEKIYDSLKLTKISEQGQELKKNITGMIVSLKLNQLIIFITGLILIIGAIIIVLLKYRK